MSEAASEQTTGGPGIVPVVVYAAARLLLAAVVSGAIYGVARLLGVADFPVTVAVLLGLVVAMPLGMWVFGPLRRRATAALEVTGERRRKERDELRARLRGDAVADSGSDED
ncbi:MULTISPECIES: DUF4229 domain-containing protein [Mycobacterium]|uniref:Membrane protein n=1 Tax=Mycobacterium kiyosense TaxID=2871094 RepID=A0A9P3Q7K5_9MYCO|nr:MULTISPECIES: DUF4229 domain-containing protein [Mycobacterium]BDB40419.1 membrane protein [Mycobacterium kiyosense]BDE12237.1 membrane protein [Mycobacterium sp. 20KCMC460]GLB86115.1 membrane protein [Mycobacterium kiyosense]GLB91579.1 membrane protein [Mycobacterium kiyosense]GLB95122.1 membrane protein [Mycobacterium kiyosense]